MQTDQSIQFSFERGGGRVGKLLVPGRPIVWQGPTTLAEGADEACLDIFFSRLSFLTPFSLSLRETARYRLKYCLKGPLSPKQPTNQPIA